MPPGAFLRIQHFEFNPHALGQTGEMGVSIHMSLGICQPDAAISKIISDRVFGICGQLLVEFDRVAFETNHYLRHAEIGNLCRRMPCGAGG